MSTLLSSAAAGNGDSTSFNRGGEYIFRVGGTFSGATVKLQELGIDGSTWEDIPGATLAAAGKVSLTLTSGTRLRAVVTGGTSPSISADINGVF